MMSSSRENKIPNPSLHDDLLSSIFARVSILYYPTLSLVSKSFQSLLTSPDLYRNRSVIGRTDSCLYVCLTLHPDPKPLLFTFSRKPNKTLTNHVPKKCNGSGNMMLPIKISQAHWKCVVAVGSSVYAIGQQAHPKAVTSLDHYNASHMAKDINAYSSSVSVLDCRTHTWRECPSMRVKRNLPCANVVDGKIYVAGGCKEYKSSEWMEVFDPKTQAWEIVASTFPQRDVFISGVIDGEIYMVGYNLQGVIYKPREDKWEATQAFLGPRVVDCVSWCIVGNILYGYSYWNGIQWYNPKMGEWNTLKGSNHFPGLPRIRSSVVRLVDFGGKIAVLWDEKPPLGKTRLVQYEEEKTEQNKILWCGVIKLKELNCDEIKGEVEWLNPLLTVPSSYEIEHALCATV